jgi:hypothetical protein
MNEKATKTNEKAGKSTTEYGFVVERTVGRPTTYRASPSAPRRPLGTCTLMIGGEEHLVERAQVDHLEVVAKPPHVALCLADGTRWAMAPLPKKQLEVLVAMLFLQRGELANANEFVPPAPGERVIDIPLGSLQKME